jgi:hypothetical protein
VVIGAAAACTAFEPGTDELEQEAVVEALGGTENWQCLSEGAQTRAVPIVASDAPRVILSVQLVDSATSAVFSDVQVRACSFSDVNCERPVTAFVAADSAGWVDMPLYESFTGFLEVTSPVIMPFLHHVKDPLPAESVIEYPLALLPLRSLEPLAQLSGLAYEVGTGVVATRSFDCNGVPAGGVSITSDSGGIPWYYSGGIPTQRTTGSDDDGIGGIFNVPAGLAIIDSVAPTGVSISGPQSLVIRAGWMSGTFIRPPGGRLTTQQR